jgi:23S rRNA (adenine2503-C2)-methyltransferase
VAILTDENGLALSKRRITLSTSGIVEGIRELADRGPETRLALSLTTADDELRSRLMPINKTNSLDRLKEALVYYQKRYKKRITLEAVLLKGLNTRLEDAKALKNFAQGLETIINLIPWNPVEDLSLEGEALQEPTEAEVERFALELERRGLAVTRRYRKGRGVAGACGQLGSTELFPPQS